MCVDQIEMPLLRSPSGAPVPVGARPTSMKTSAGGRQLANCQRSHMPLKPPAWANSGGGSKSTIQRPTRKPSFCRSVLTGVTASRGCLLYTSDAADDLLCVDLGG